MLFSIEELVIKSIKVPFSSRAILDEERLLDLLEELRATLPKEIEEAQALLTQRDELLAEAQRRAEAIMTDAREAANRMIDENEVMARAQAEADKVRAELAQEMQVQQAGADRYADEVLSELEAKIARALSTIQNGRSQLNVK